MNLKYKYTFVLGATLALSFCQGKHSAIFDPTQGQNAMTAQQYLNTAVDSRSLPQGDTRSQRYALNYTEEQANTCINTAAETGALSPFCNQIVNDYLTKIYGPNYMSFAPENIQIQAPNGRNFDYNASDRLSSNNAPWLPQYQQYMGGMDPNAATYYRTPMNMQNFCQNPTSVTSIQYGSNACGRLNWNYATIAVNTNTGYNAMGRGYDYYRQGDTNNASIYFNRAAPIYGPGGYLQQRAPLLYGTVLSRRDVGKENVALQKELEASWTNMKQLPKNAGLRIANRALDIPASILERMLSRFEAGASRITATNYVAAGYDQQQTAYNDAVANNYFNAYRASQYATLSAIPTENGGTPCPADKYYYQIGDTKTDNNQYQVITCGK